MNSNSLIPKRIMASNISSSEQKIPRTIFQTFKNNNVPVGMYNAAMSWVNNNPDYEYCFADDEDCHSLIKENFDHDVLRAFEQLEAGAFKADLWRYCALYVHGGVYADLDTFCTYPLQKIIDTNDDFVSVFASAVAGGIFNAFICSTPRHVFLKRAIDEAVKMIFTGKPDHPLALTGPLCLGRAVNMELARDKDTRFTEGQHYVNGYSFKILEKQHSTDPNKRNVAYKGQTVFKCKYDGYEADLAQTGQKYWMDFF